MWYMDMKSCTGHDICTSSWTTVARRIQCDSFRLFGVDLVGPYFFSQAHNGSLACRSHERTEMKHFDPESSQPKCVVGVIIYHDIRYLRNRWYGKVNDSYNVRPSSQDLQKHVLRELQRGGTALPSIAVESFCSQARSLVLSFCQKVHAPSPSYNFPSSHC